MSKSSSDVKCPICGKMDNDWEERGGLCLECYCKALFRHAFDDVGGRCPSLEEASRIIKKELHENHRLSAL